MSNASEMLQILDLVSLRHLAGWWAVRYEQVGIQQSKTLPLKLIDLTLTKILTKVPFNQDLSLEQSLQMVHSIDQTCLKSDHIEWGK